MLEAKGIKKSYGDVHVLKGVDLKINQGEIVSIVGASGAGKTTLLQILGTLDRPDTGSVTLDGQDVFGMNDKRLSKFRNDKLGFVFQFHHLLPEFTALENAIMPGLIGRKPETELRANAAEYFELLNIGHRTNHKPSELSGGEQQRVAVARALCNRPEFILADEPSGNLDSSNANELHDLFFTLRDRFNTSFIIVTHNDELANRADRKIVMRDGLIS